MVICWLLNVVGTHFVEKYDMFALNMVNFTISGAGFLVHPRVPLGYEFGYH